MMRAANLTFLFSDLVGSTRILERLDDVAGERLMRTHFDMLRTAISQHHGHVVKTLGDGIMGIFARPGDGLACAVAMQHGVVRHNLANPDTELAMRVGVHCGPAVRMAGDYYGVPVVIAKRLCDHCTGGQVLVSEAVRRAAIDADELSFDAVGGLTCKGVSEAVIAAELRWERRPPLRIRVELPRPSLKPVGAVGPLFCGPGEP